MRNVNYLRLLSDQAHPLFVFCRCVLGKPLFEMCWFYMGIAQIALDPPPLSVKQANVEKKCPKPSWQALTPSGKRGEKVPYTIMASLSLSGNAHMETTHFKKGLPWFIVCVCVPHTCRSLHAKYIYHIL